MIRYRKLIALALCLLMVAGLTSACSTDTPAPTTTKAPDTTTTTPAGTAAPTTTGPHKPVDLRFMWWGGDARHAATLEVISQFQDKYPYVTISPEYGSDVGYQEKLTTQLNSGSAADIIQGGVSWMITYVNQGADYFIDFQDYPDKIDLSTFDKGFLEGNGYYKGHQYGLPTGVSGSCIVLNKNLMDSFGIDLTKAYTWDDLITMGKKVHEADSSVYLLDLDATLCQTIVGNYYLKQLTGNPLIIDETKTLGFTKAEMVQLLTYVKSLYDNNVVPPVANVAAYEKSLQTDPNWIAGKYVGMFCYTSTAEVMTAANPNATYAAAMLPKMTGAKNDGWLANTPQIMLVNKDSVDVDTSVMFLDYFYNSEEAAASLKTVRSVPPTTVGRKVCSDIGALTGIVADTVNVCLQFKGITSQGMSDSAEAGAIMKDTLMSVAYGQSTPEEAADNAIQLLNTYLSK